MNIQKRAVLTAVTLAGAATTLPAYAATDFSTLTDAFSATDVSLAIMAVGAVLAAIYVAIKGVQYVTGLIRRG